jgi:hypothetical protein
LHDGGSGGTDNGALIDCLSFACFWDGGGGGTSDMALAQVASPLASLHVGGSGSSADYCVSVF